MMNFLRIPIRRQKIGLLLVDIVLITLSLPVASLIRGVGLPEEVLGTSSGTLPAMLIGFLRYYTGATAITIVVFVTCFFIFDLYNVEIRRGSPRDLMFLGFVSGLAILVISTLFYLAPNWRVGRGLLGIQAMFITLTVFTWRLIYSRIHKTMTRLRRLLIVGTGDAARVLIDEIHNEFQFEFEIVGVIATDSEAEGDDFCGCPVLGGPMDLTRVARERGIELLVSTMPRLRGDVGAALMKQVLELKTVGLEIYEMPTFFKKITGRVPVDWIRDSWLVFNQKFSLVGGGAAERVRRILDIVIAAGCLLVLSPVLLLIACAIKLTSRGPVLYTQERVGLNGGTYEIYKFRSMVVDAEKRHGPVWSAGKNDARVTLVGRLLRRTRMDEIPNFLNVLNGEMSVVGPRPERAHFVEQLRKEIPYYDLRFAAKPGLTGWAQVNYPYGASIEDARKKLQYELFYIQERSLLLDFYILVKTAQTVLLRPGS